MKLDEIREELLGQHAAIRGLVEVAEEAAAEALAVARGGASGAVAEEDRAGEAGTRLRAHLLKLQDALERHNAREEGLLRGVIRRVDAWGDVREMLMDAHHAGEHHGILAALDGTRAVGERAGETAVLEVQALLGRLRAHIKEEEEKILHPRVLTDDIVGGDTFGG